MLQMQPTKQKTNLKSKEPWGARCRGVLLYAPTLMSRLGVTLVAHTHLKGSVWSTSLESASSKLHDLCERRAMIESILQARFGEVDSQLATIINPLIAMNREEFTPLNYPVRNY